MRSHAENAGNLQWSEVTHEKMLEEVTKPLWAVWGDKERKGHNETLKNFPVYPHPC